MNTFHKNDKWQFLVFNNCNDAVAQQINTCTWHMLICRYNHVYLHGIFAYENINVVTFKCIFGHYGNKRFFERIPQFHPSTGMDIALIFMRTFSLMNWCVLRAEYNGIYFINNPHAGHLLGGCCLPHLFMLSVFLCWYIALAGFGLCLTLDLEFTSYTTFVDSTGLFFIVCIFFLVTSEYLHISTALLSVSFTSLS